MAVKPQKDPRYKLVAEKGGRRYRDTITGELLNRKQYEERTRGQNPANQDRSQTGPRKTPGNQGPAQEPAQTVGTGSIGSDLVDMVPGPVPMADMPEPPPLLSGLNQAAQTGVDVAAAAAQKTSDSLANMIGEAVALCANLVLDMRASSDPAKQYQVLEAAALERVTKPASRLILRRLPVDVEMVGPDGQDSAELFKGVMYCVTAIWANKQVYNAEMRKREEEYAALYDAHYGAGSYQAARAAAAGQNAGYAGANGTGQVTPGSSAGQAAVPAGNGYAGTARATANGSGNHSGDGGRAAGLIYTLYQKYPGNNGQSPGLGRAV